MILSAKLKRKSLPAATPYYLLTATNIGLVLDDGEDNIAIALRDLDMNALTATDCVDAGDCDALQLNDTALIFYYGRTILKNSFGPENVALAMPVETQYYNNSGFVLNNYNSCASYVLADAVLSEPLPLPTLVPEISEIDHAWAAY